MSEYIPAWATHYRIHQYVGGVERHNLVITFCNANPATVSGWSPLEQLAHDLAVGGVLQQMRDKPLHSRIDVIGQSGNTGEHYDEINPDHYKQGSVECIDAIESALTPDEFRGYCKGNVLKYTWRERHKQQATALRKAMWYLERLVKVLEK